MKIINLKWLVVFLLCIIKSDLFSLSEIEKHDLFYSATNIKVIYNIPSIDGELKPCSRDRSNLKCAEINWKGNPKAKFKYFVGPFSRNNSALSIEDNDKDSTLFLVFNAFNRTSTQLYYINKKGKKLINYFPEINDLIPLPSVITFSSKGKAGAISCLTTKMSLGHMKTMIDMLPLSKNGKKKKIRQLSNLTPLKNENLAVSLYVFREMKRKEFNLSDFKKSYSYNFSTFDETSYKEQSVDSCRYYMLAIGHDFYFNRVNPKTLRRLNHTMNGVFIYIYDRKTNFFIKISDESYLDKKAIDKLNSSISS